LDDLEEGSPVSETENGKPKTRIVQRILHVHLANGSNTTQKKLQAVIYVVSVPTPESLQFTNISH
jgi:hypothetical protein